MLVTRLSNFIRGNLDGIMTTWEQFAKAIPVAHPLDTAALRDHAQGILLAIADDLELPQSAHQQREKSQGRGPRSEIDTEAELHGAGRVLAGFSINDELAEFRALRASVLRLWSEADQDAACAGSEDLARFNEAIDQALAESVTRHAADKERNWRLFDALMSSSSDLSFIFDTNGKFIYANQALAQLYNTTPEDIIGKDMFELNVTAAGELQERLLEVLGNGTSFRGEVPCARAGHVGTFECRLVAVRNKESRVEAVTGVAHDITERKATEEKIKRSANYDSLTGLPNRSLFRDRLLQELKRAGRSGLPLALIFIDLDGFKDVNDRVGHDAGDRLLQQAAQRISACVRGVDTVARLGGDEFTVIFTDVSHIGHLDILAQKILDELAQPFPLGPETVQISGSVGITFYPQDAGTPDELIRNADQAMYVAKNAGRNRFSFFTVGMRDAAWARRKVIDELRRALPQRQLSVYYQPIVELAAAQRIVKAEALLRWHHPQSGLMLPAAFIGLAEETGLIAEIGAWVLDEALARARDWSARLGAPFQISVNKSLVEFTGKAGAASWDSELAARGGGNVSVEITERVLLSDLPSVAGKLACLQRAGVQLVIDKFGIGCSSLACLKKFDVDYLKIDQSFVRGVDGVADGRAIAETIIVMAHKLGLKVIAEGVETAEQRDWLLAAQCDYAQGYLFSAPLSAPEFERLLDL